MTATTQAPNANEMTAPDSASAKKAEGPRLPGEQGIWLFVLGDMLVFALFFATFLYYKGQQPEVFAAGQASLNTTLGTLNTLLLLTSSWCIASAVTHLQQSPGDTGRLETSRRLITLAGLCGLAFVVVKILEYREKVNAGFGLTTNDFYMLFYMFTGIHLIHVLVGLLVLFVVRLLLGNKTRAPATTLNIIESGATYWHMVDLLWIVLFPLLYLLV